MSGWSQFVKDIAPVPIVGGLFQGGNATKELDTAQTDEDRRRALAFYNQVNAERAGVAPHAPTVGTAAVTAPVINDAQAQQMRAQQADYLDALRMRAAGQAPSAATAMLAGANRDTAALNLGTAGMAHGTAGVAARRAAIMGNADAFNRNALNAAQVRAQEQAAAQAQLGGALSNVRAADTGAAQFAAGQALQAGTTNAQLAQHAAETNAANNLQAQQISNAYRLGLGQQTLQSGAQANESTAQKLGIQSGNRASALGLYSASLGGGGTIAAGLMSGGKGGGG